MDTKENLSVTIIQSDVVWENPSENRKRLTAKINSISVKTDLIVFPEMFTTGFTMNVTKVAETMNGKTINWMQQLAKEKDAAIVGSIAISENTNFYNRLLFVHPSGKIETYDKRHAFTLAGEHMVYSEGKKRLIVNYKGWKICPLVCYDLRFPVWSRNTHNYDLLVYVASWPKPRINAWDTLLKARAVENMSYTIGVNRVGVDNNGYEYVGHTNAYDLLGNSLSKENNEQEDVIIMDLDKNAQNTVRNKLGFLNDKDEFTLQI